MKLCAVIDTDAFLDTWEQATKIRVLNCKEEIKIPDTSIIPLNAPKPSDILQHPWNANRKVMSEIMSPDKIKELW